MKKLNVLYNVRKNEIYSYYKKYKEINLDNIQDINDKIVDVHLKKENFENPLEEFYNIVSICSYMIDNDLYDEYFFNTYDEILEEYDMHKYDDYFMDIQRDRKDIGEDIYKINEYLSMDNDKMNYYDSLSEIYSNDENE